MSKYNCGYDFFEWDDSIHAIDAILFLKKARDIATELGLKTDFVIGQDEDVYYVFLDAPQYFRYVEEVTSDPIMNYGSVKVFRRFFRLLDLSFDESKARWIPAKGDLAFRGGICF